MPLMDQPEFRAWLAQHQEHSRALGIPSCDQPQCEACRIPADQQTMLGERCIVCLAGLYATDQVHQRIAAIIHAFNIAATDPSVFARFFASTLDRLEDAISDVSTESS